jgi:hypothetical protein
MVSKKDPLAMTFSEQRVLLQKYTLLTSGVDECRRYALPDEKDTGVELIFKIRLQRGLLRLIFEQRRFSRNFDQTISVD